MPQLRRRWLGSVSGGERLVIEPSTGEGASQMEALTETTALHPAYIAGFIDGEGCISIIAGKRSNGGNPDYRVALQVTNRNRAPLDGIRATFGAGSIYPMRKNDPNRSDLWQYLLRGRVNLRR